MLLLVDVSVSAYLFTLNACDMLMSFYRAAYMQGGLSYGKRVRSSVRLSVTRVNCDNERKFRRDSYTI